MNDVNDPQVTLKQSELTAIMQNIKDLQMQVAQGAAGKADIDEGTGKMRLRATKERKVTVLFVNGKPLIGIKNMGSEAQPMKVYDEVDPHNNQKRILVAHVQLQNLETGAITTEKVNWVEFIRNAEKRELRVLKTNEEAWEIEQGVVRKKEVDGYSTVELDVEVPLIVEGTVRVFVVDVNGTAINIHEDYVNIAK